MSDASPALLAGIETRSIDYVPPAERHGRVADQAKFWFLGNFQFFTIAIGFIGPSLGLSMGYTILAATLGILIGTFFQAFHASQGAEMGLPQMIQSRAQFGYRGVVVPLFATLFTYLGFNVADTVLTGDGLRALAGWNPALVVIAMSALGAVLAIWGHDWLHRAFKLLFWVSLPAFTLLTAAILLGHAGGAAPRAGGFSLVAFATQLAAGASYNITYATYVSDYSRYLPANTRRGPIIASVFAGAAFSAIWLIAVGAWLATRMGASDALVALAQAGNAMWPGMGMVLAAVSIAALTATMGMNAYSGMLTVLTALDAIRPLRPTQALRVATILGLTVIWSGLAIGFGGDAIAVLNGSFVVMLYLLVPWTAINLLDYFYVRRGQYAVLELFKPDGIYGRWRRDGLLAYGIGFAASIPFFVIPGAYTGPVAASMGGVDIGWLVGLIATGLAYLALTRRFDPRAEAAAIAASRAALAGR